MQYEFTSFRYNDPYGIKDSLELSCMFVLQCNLPEVFCQLTVENCTMQDARSVMHPNWKDNRSSLLVKGYSVQNTACKKLMFYFNFWYIYTLVLCVCLL